ncbi:hypothetical protein F8M41_004165 [Gigaspora margarita]|uniref:Uncharacterized protein n=1 Tax=Gigaspora margarita TaxID=4874 RepID=A0A8H4A6W1_GIGMA|nr:hypothetical protein F8M41_004165 [Gigaspora margarita]
MLNKIESATEKDDLAVKLIWNATEKDSCLKYLQLWVQHFENCKREITNQNYKMLKLIYFLSEVFFTLLILCHQEQQREVSQKTLDKSTDNWKGTDIKSRMNKNFGNMNSRSILKNWTA